MVSLDNIVNCASLVIMSILSETTPMSSRLRKIPNRDIAKQCGQMQIIRTLPIEDSMCRRSHSPKRLQSHCSRSDLSCIKKYMLSCITHILLYRFATYLNINYLEHFGRSIFFFFFFFFFLPMLILLLSKYLG